jgi:hypothetical protein
MTAGQTRQKLKEVRLSYPNLSTPQAPEDSNSEPKFNVTLLIPEKSAKHRQLLDAVDALKKDDRALKKWGGKVPPKNKLETNIRTEDDNLDNDGEIPDGYEGMVTINAKASPKHPMALVDRHVNPVDRADADEVFYGGVYANVMVEPYAYKVSGKVGIGWGLLGVQLAHDGDSLGGVARIDVDKEFDDLGDDDETDNSASTDDGDDW